VAGRREAQRDDDAVELALGRDRRLVAGREAGGQIYDYDGSEHGSDSRYTLASVPSLAETLRCIVAEAM
jgi:hypothetical protein